jgi:hypothetical protein
LDQEGENDWLLKETIGDKFLFARPYVLYQWIKVLKVVNQTYSDVVIPSIPELKRLLKESKEYILKNAVWSHSDHELRFEEGIGADIAEIRTHDANAAATMENHTPPLWIQPATKRTSSSKS